MIDQRTAPYAALLLRVTLGALFIVHIYWKFAIFGFDTWLQRQADAGYSMVVVIYVICAESIAALLLIPGILTRWVCLFALPLMIGASQFWLVRTGFFFTVSGAEFPMLWALALVVQALLGDGAFAVKLPWLHRNREQPAATSAAQ